jgi:hypothetical protein
LGELGHPGYIGATYHHDVAATTAAQYVLLYRGAWTTTDRSFLKRKPRAAKFHKFAEMPDRWPYPHILVGIDLGLTCTGQSYYMNKLRSDTMLVPKY